MANKKVEGLWVVTGFNYRYGTTNEYQCKSRVATTVSGKNAAIRAAWEGLSVARVEVEEYVLGEMTLTLADSPK